MLIAAAAERQGERTRPVTGSQQEFLGEVPFLVEDSGAKMDGFLWPAGEDVRRQTARDRWNV
jgi:hypothetical protein